MLFKKGKEEDSIGVKILEIDGEYKNSKNIHNYITHHFDDSSVDFYDVEFKNPVYVVFKLSSDTYQMALKRISNRRLDLKKINVGHKYLCATHNDENITDLMNQFHGPNRNFYIDNSDALSIYENAYFKYKTTIRTINSIGKKEEIIIN